METAMPTYQFVLLGSRRWTMEMDYRKRAVVGGMLLNGEGLGLGRAKRQINPRFMHLCRQAGILWFLSR
jgi:hypothetical protein